MTDVRDYPTHQPSAPEAPIPGRHWYGGCDPDRPRVGPDGICLGCGEIACPECGREDCPDHPWEQLEATARFLAQAPAQIDSRVTDSVLALQVPRHNPDAEAIALLDRRWPNGKSIRESVDDIGRGNGESYACAECGRLHWYGRKIGYEACPIEGCDCEGQR